MCTSHVTFYKKKNVCILIVVFRLLLCGLTVCIRAKDGNNKVPAAKSLMVAFASTVRPGILDFTGRVKWDAWNAKKGQNLEN